MKNWKYIEGAKTGNDTPWEYAHHKPKVINDDKTGAEEFFKQLSDDVKEREDKDDADIEKVGNSFGNTLLSWSEKALIAKGQYEDAKRPAEKQYIKSYAQKDMQFLKNNISRVKDDAELKDIKKAIDIYQKIGNKVGNARYTTREDVISHLDTDLYDICKKVPAGSPSFAYVSELQKKGWDISTISKYTKEIGKIIDQYKVGNSKTGNSAHSDKVEVIKRLLNAKWSVQEIYELLKKEGYEVDKNFIERLKVGNSKVKKTLFKSLATPTTWTPGINGRPISGAPEFKGTFAKDEAEKWTDKWIKDHGFEVENKTGNSAQDDKFAYVMREFDEGKLKTPDGKVVTDPAQAKAIAYSESKKTENGLARARNAMACNKKVGNHDFEEGDYVLYNGQKAVVRGFNGSQEVIIEQNGRRITTHWSNLEEYE